MLFQGLLFIVAVVGCTSVLYRFLRKELIGSSVVFWLVCWLLLGVFAIMPNATSHVAQFFGVGRGVDIVVYAALIVLFFLVFRCLIALEKMRREITILVRDNALLKEQVQVVSAKRVI
jgi:hypothetical protein